MSVWDTETEALLERNQQKASQPVDSLWGSSVMEGEELSGWLDEQRVRQARQKADAVLQSNDEETRAVVTEFVAEKSSEAVQRTQKTHKNLMFLVVCFLVVVVTAASFALLSHFAPQPTHRVGTPADNQSEFIVGGASVTP